MNEISQLNFSPERAFNLLKAQQNAAIDGILVIDENRKVLSYNNMFLDLWAIPDEIAAQGEDQSLIGHVVSSLVDVDAFIGKIMYLYENASESSRDEIALKDGRVFDRYSSPVIDGEGKNWGRIWFFRDITKRKKLELELKQKSETLENTVEEVNQINEELQGTLEQLNQINEELQGTLEQLADKNKEVQKKNENTAASIHYAKRIQQAMLPEDKLIKRHFPVSFVLNKPKDIVSGDFYWCDGVDNKKFLVAADCTGHGIPGAFMSMLGMSGLSNIILQKEIYHPSEILSALHQHISHSLRQNVTESQDGMEMIVIMHDTTNQQVLYAGAMNAIYYIQNEELFEIKATKMPIGGSQHGMERHYDAHIIDVSKSTVFYLCSDGYQDQFGGTQNRKFTTARMKKLFLEIHKQPLSAQEQVLDMTFEAWREEGHEHQIDDMLVIGVKI
jgi:serine phosphatase RsbU (regulator of sigma subunit)